jgi:hypothetical protein
MDWRNSKGPDLEKNFLPGSFLLKKDQNRKKNPRCARTVAKTKSFSVKTEDGKQTSRPAPRADNSR